MSGNKKDDDAGIALLQDIKKVFDENDQTSFGTEALVQQLINLPETRGRNGAGARSPSPQGASPICLRPSTSTQTTSTVRAFTGRRILRWRGRLICLYLLLQVVLVVNLMKPMRK
jgi:hypothetical protein